MATIDMKHQNKTTAKRRYLRRKRDRRKQKAKVLKASRPALNDRKDAGSESDEDVDLDESINAAEALITTPPRKRRRVVEGELLDVRGTNEHSLEQDEYPDYADEEQTHSASVDPATLGVALPTFPLLALPDAPSPTDLALQGLDQALLEAEFVDSSHVCPYQSDDVDDAWASLSKKMKKRLMDLGIQELFAVQTSLLPFLLKNGTQNCLYMPYDPPRDVCVSAPTGSGKTLAYVIPIVETLSPRVVTRLRALIVLPTRDLVTQVRETFEAISKGRSLKIGTVTGQHSFVYEQSQLVADQSPHIRGGSSKVDILIGTPGRLMDHLNGTPNFSLQHLRFLVIDEADRLLAQSFQDWLVQVLAATRAPSHVAEEVPWQPSSNYPSVDCVSPAYSSFLPEMPTNVVEKKESSCQKLLFSATLTRDPGKIATLELRQPKYFIVQEKKLSENGADSLNVVMENFSTPATLREHMVVCESSLKPLVFFYLVHVHSVTNALVFTKSAESTTRLVQLFEYFEESRAAGATSGDRKLAVRAYSSDLSPGDRKATLEQFRAQEIQILVCSDLIARGMDIHHVSHVVSYDAPVDIRKYVHRVGRTARAGRDGDAWTLVEEQEAHYFKHMLKDANHLSKVKHLRVSTHETQSLTPYYEAALKRLKEVYTR